MSGWSVLSMWSLTAALFYGIPPNFLSSPYLKEWIGLLTVLIQALAETVLRRNAFGVLPSASHLL